jgi:hypothetical protein
LRISKEHGFIFGDRDNYKMYVEIICSNQKIESHVCVKLLMNIEAHLELSMQNLLFTPILQEMIVKNM